MIKIDCKKDIQQLKDFKIQLFIEGMFDNIIKEYKAYCTNGKLDSIGAIFFIESSEDFEQYTAFGLSSPITDSRFEIIEDTGIGYYNACIVIDNDKAINIISKKEDFIKYFGEVDVL